MRPKKMKSKRQARSSGVRATPDLLGDKVSSFEVSSEEDGLRLDGLVRRRFPYLSYASTQKMLRRGAIRLDQEPAKAATRVEQGQQISLRVPLVERKRKRLLTSDLQRYKALLPQLVIFHDSCLLVINKPPGLPVQAGTNHQLAWDRIVDAVFPNEHLKLVHRLDKDTSGVLVFACGRKNAAAIARAFAQQQVKKHYWALVEGIPKEDHGTVESLIPPEPSSPITLNDKTAATRTAANKRKPHLANTAYRVLAYCGKQYALLELMPRTGCKHQLRVHCKTLLGTPIVGDHRYSTSTLPLANRLHLHAFRITIPNPNNDKNNYTFTAPLADDLLEIWTRLGFEKFHFATNQSSV